MTSTTAIGHKRSGRRVSAIVVTAALLAIAASAEGVVAAETPEPDPDAPPAVDAPGDEGTSDDDGVEELEVFVEDLAPVVDEESEPTVVADLVYERWDDVWGQSLGDVPLGGPPTSTEELVGGFESPVDVGDQHATRMRTLLTPTESGDYRFYVSGDDDVRLFMNTGGEDPLGATLVAYVAGWTTHRQWRRYDSQHTDWTTLEAGKPYYLELIGKEGSSSDHYSVGWERNGIAGISVVPGDVLEATQLGAGGWRLATPAGLPLAPAPMTDPHWNSTSGPETLAISWAESDGADWYEVRLEGGAQAREVKVTDPNIEFDNLVPNTRYLLEVAAANEAAVQPSVARVFVTGEGSYDPPLTPDDGTEPSVAYDRWDTGWWTLTSIPEGLEPISTSTLTYGFETPPMLGENHAARLRAVLKPTETGEYTFHVSADDDARLLFNPEGSNADGASAIAYVSGWSAQYQWGRYESQASVSFRLQADRSYYIEAIAVHALGLDHLEVGWSRDGGPVEVIPAGVLSPTMAGSGGWRRDATALPKPPGEPRALTTSIDDGFLAATWQPPEVDDQSGEATFYEVVVSKEQEVVERRVVHSLTMSVAIDRVRGVEYEVAVRSWNEAGESDWLRGTATEKKEKKQRQRRRNRNWWRPWQNQGWHRSSRNRAVFNRSEPVSVGFGRPGQVGCRVRFI